MLVRFPVLAVWDQYQLEVAEVFQTLTVRYPDIDVPPDIMELAQAGHFQAWTAIMSCAFRLKGIQKKLIHIVRAYLNPQVEGSEESPEEQWAWIEENFPVSDVVLLFAAILMLDDWLEKKSRHILMRAFQRPELAPASVGSVGKQEPRNPLSGSGRRSASGFGR